MSGTSRSTIEPPLIAPFDFGIDQGWLENESERYARLVKDWGTHGNPEGFGETEEDQDGWADQNVMQGGEDGLMEGFYDGGESVTQSYGGGESITQSYGGDSD